MVEDNIGEVTVNKIPTLIQDEGEITVGSSRKLQSKGDLVRVGDYILYSENKYPRQSYAGSGRITRIREISSGIPVDFIDNDPSIFDRFVFYISQALIGEVKVSSAKVSFSTINDLKELEGEVTRGGTK